MSFDEYPASPFVERPTELFLQERLFKETFEEEVETGKSDALLNIEKALSAGLTVLTVATSSEVEKKIKDQLSRQPQLDHGRVRIVNAQSCTWD